MNAPPPDRPFSPIRRDLRNSTLDGAGWSVMVGMGEIYVPAFALAAGRGPVVAGLVATVPMLLGSVLQLAGPAGARRLGSLRRWTVLLSALQALVFLPLALGAAAGEMGTVALFALMTLYWGSGLATAPPWVTWIETLVPRVLRARYFGRRGILTNGVLLAAILLGGWILDGAEAGGRVLAGFAVLFLCAGLGRGASAAFLAAHREPLKPTCRPVGPREILSGLRRTPAGRLILGMTAMQAGLFVALPFFTPWVLETLRFSYGRYTALVAALFLARMLLLPLLARVADARGPRFLLVAAGIGFVPVTLLWVLLDGFLPLLLVQVLAGAVTAAWELATLMLFFDTVPREERLGVFTWFNLANAVALVLGSLAGGALLDGLGGDAGAYAAVFLASAVLRLLCLPLLLGVPDPERPFHERGEAELALSGEARGAGPGPRR